MSARLRGLQLGDVVYLGRWMKEFDYRKHLTNAAGELGLICTTSGASVALQLMQVIDKNKEDKTKLKVLYCHFTANGIPFKKEYFDKFIERNKERIRVSYNVLSLGGKKKEDGFVLGENTFLGNIDSSTVEATMPPPIITKQIKGEDEKDVVQARRPYMCVCGPQSMLTYVCGRTSPISNYYYWQGWPYRYTGFLKDMGYTRDQVYKFGVSTHFLAVH
ncbi:cytochrome-b5 reductase [Angomonas deanei]|nr:cytochrome-b5 reductase [Angomonas deanei]EPY39409.1 cytochrome-b5 reductase [Angomonas deanei]|eukprot:EPY35919.1 cytochrome-b5 reductase [Angomonas deanei]